MVLLKAGLDGRLLTMFSLGLGPVVIKPALHFDHYTLTKFALFLVDSHFFFLLVNNDE